MTADTVTASPTTKKRGACNRTISGCFVRVLVVAMPNWFASVAARAVAFQLVSESGYLILTTTMPSFPVMTSGCHRMVERKSERTCTGDCGSPGGEAGGVSAKAAFASKSLGALAGAAAD